MPFTPPREVYGLFYDELYLRLSLITYSIFHLLVSDKVKRYNLLTYLLTYSMVQSPS